jgi:hypothetical protein
MVVFTPASVLVLVLVVVTLTLVDGHSVKRRECVGAHCAGDDPKKPPPKCPVNQESEPPCGGCERQCTGRPTYCPNQVIINIGNGNYT